MVCVLFYCSLKDKLCHSDVADPQESSVMVCHVAEGLYLPQLQDCYSVWEGGIASVIAWNRAWMLLIIQESLSS